MHEHFTADPESGFAGLLRATVAWVGVAVGKAGIHQWSDVAALLASIYSALLIAGWLYRRWWRWRHGVPDAGDTGRDEA